MSWEQGWEALRLPCWSLSLFLGSFALGEASCCVEDTQMALYRGLRSLQSKASKEPKLAGSPVSGLGGRSPRDCTCSRQLDPTLMRDRRQEPLG